MERGKEDFEEFPDEALNLIWARRRRALGYLCLDKDILAMGETLNKGFPVFFQQISQLSLMCTQHFAIWTNIFYKLYKYIILQHKSPLLQTNKSLLQ